MSPETLVESKPSRYLAQQEKIPRRRHATGASPGGAIGVGRGRVWWGLGLEAAAKPELQ
jgi:hypothetical protein